MSAASPDPIATADEFAARSGVLPAQELRALAASGALAAEPGLLADQIQPASLDLRLGRRAWRVRASFLAGRRATVSDRLAEFAMHEIDLGPGAVLETGCVYVVELAERLALPAGVSAAANAKSSTGRLDLFTRLIGDRQAEFDRVEAGYAGPLHVEISPRTFSVLVRPGARLNQLRLRAGHAVIADEALRALHRAEPLVDTDEALIDGGLGFSVDLSPQAADGTVGWRARRHSGLIDLDRIGHYPVGAFWEPVRAQTASGGIILDPGAFYILVSREAVSVPPATAAEMVPYMAVAGEFRVHYAGFFDPGFGHREAGGQGSRGVLEVRCHEAPFALEHGQMVGRLVYERMRARPDLLYGRDIGSNYQGQALKLSKHFQSP
ncbi:2'-deoxycytidine 5'-triphosphate deaminase [Paralimibaculum aggregatum]|uniref:2'-deoxycytidine 5'-triphosphate deaminase n=1 Tax=Paralimibaculum aggregatum TaxID=3036245 RepID=A0ABQ6LM16_9RHOB|nr:2'-deoxycytidine 5'-triphosphate deaminase [Limibaculum sp. NKW23]GMG83486.1 2'-deoxycytidine 5'-triphosphate deaminase [Limibaculum sp. NKW23]